MSVVRPRGRAAHGARQAVVEAAWIAALLGLYNLARILIAGQDEVARRHASFVRGLEETLRLPSEAALQAAVHSETLFRAANLYYTTVHLPAMAVFLIWGFVTQPRPVYQWARNLLALQTGAALVIHAGFPLAPPRMFPEWGFVDTMKVYGPSAYDGASGDLANQFAAMPSLHVGWAVLIAYVVTKTGPRWVARITWAHAALTTFIVVVTANHWWVDAAVGVGLLWLAQLTVAKHRRSQPLP